MNAASERKRFGNSAVNRIVNGENGFCGGSFRFYGNAKFNRHIVGNLRNERRGEPSRNKTYFVNTADFRRVSDFPRAGIFVQGYGSRKICAVHGDFTGQKSLYAAVYTGFFKFKTCIALFTRFLRRFKQF